MRHREKGQLPTEPARRRIHTLKFKIQGSLNVVEWEIWDKAQAARHLLESRPDGTVPGRCGC